MQLEIPFDYTSDNQLLFKNKENNPYLEEFKRGNFSNLLKQNIYSSQEEIIDILLRSEDTLPELKIAILKKMVYNTKYISEKIIDDIRENNRKHNDRVRYHLKQSFEKEDKSKLKKMGLKKFWKYNNFYWESFWGKSIQGELDENVLIKEKIRIEKENDITKCINYLLLLNISDIWDILAICKNSFTEKELLTIINNMELSDENKELLTYITKRIFNLFY